MSTYKNSVTVTFGDDMTTYGSYLGGLYAEIDECGSLCIFEKSEDTEESTLIAAYARNKWHNFYLP